MLVSVTKPFYGRQLQKAISGCFFASQVAVKWLPLGMDMGLEDHGKTVSTHQLSTMKDQSWVTDTANVIEMLNSLREEPFQALGVFYSLKENGFVHSPQSYAAIVKMLCAGQLWKNLDNVLLELIKYERDIGFGVAQVFECLTEGNVCECTLVLSRVSNALIEVFALGEMFDEAINFFFGEKCKGFFVSCMSCNFLMNKLIECGKVDVAIDVYNKLKRLGLSPDSYTYSIAMKGFCEQGNLLEARAVMREMEDRNMCPDACLVSNYIECLCKNQLPDLGWKVIQACVNAKVNLDVFSYTIVIRQFFHEMKIEDAENVFFGMEEHGVKPDRYVFSALISGYLKSGNLIKALSVIDVMHRSGMRIDCVIVNLILHGLCHLGMWSEAVTQFRRFNETCMFLDELNYNSVMNALCKLGCVEEAVYLLAQMKKKHVIPDTNNYNTLISGYCDAGSFLRALSLLRKMMEDGQEPNVATFLILVGAFSSHGLVQETLQLLECMETHGLKRCTALNNTVILGLCKSGKVDEAKDYLCGLKEKSLDNFCALIRGYCEADCTEMALELFIVLCEKELLVSKSTCTKLLHCLIAKESTEGAYFVFQQMVAKGMSPTVILYSKIIGMFSRHGDMRKAQFIFDSMVHNGSVLDLVVYTIMINGYCKLNQFDRAKYFFNELKSRGITPDIITYTVLVDGSLKSGETNQCSTFISEMSDQNVQPDVVFYTVLINRNCKINNMNKALSLFNQIAISGLEPDTAAYAALLSGYCRIGDEKCALDLIDVMSANGIQPDARILSTLRHCILKARRMMLQ